MTRKATVEIGKFILYAVLAICVVGYAIFAARDYMRGPEIIVAEPIDNSAVSSSTITVKGRVLRVKNLFINDRPITMDEQGNFSEMMLIYPGYNAITLAAEDRFKHSTKLEISVIGTFEDIYRATSQKALIKAVASTSAASTSLPSRTATSSIR